MSSPSAFGGARTTLLGQLAKFLIQVVGLVVLARLLTPEEYGLYGMVLVFTGIGMLIGDFGLASASIQAREISAQQRTNLFWANVGLGSLTAGIFVLLAQPLAALYTQDRLASIIMIAASAFVLQGATTQFAANATRELRFGVLAVSDVLSQAAGLLVAIFCAAAGLGVWALVLQQIAVAATLLVILAGTSRWRPGVPRRAPMRSLFVYGANTFGVQLLNFVTAKVDSFVVGKFLGATDLGFYDRAYQLNQIPTQQLATPLTRVALPLLSRHQDDISAVQSRLSIIARVMGYVLGGMILFIGANSSDVVEIVLGAQWSAVAPILAILTIGGYFQAVGYVYYWAFLSLGQTGLQLKFALATRPIMVALIVAGAFFGVNGVAFGVSVGLLINWIVLSTLAVPRVGVKAFGLVAPVLRSFSMWGICSWVVALAVDSLVAGAPAVISLLVSVVGTLVAAIVFLLLPAYRRDFRAIRILIERRGI